MASAFVRRCVVVEERIVSGTAGNRCRGQRRSMMLAVEVRGFIAVVVGMAARVKGKKVVTRVRLKRELVVSG